MKRPLGQLRIIGGQWRSRLVDFDAADGVRPTPDRVRQTLFDWLAPQIAGAAVLDLFSGSGALGLEALSRGAASATFVETGAEQARAIRAALQKLGADNAEVLSQDALRFLSNTPQRYDIVTLDPPYDSPLLERALALLPRVLKPHNRVYLEWPKTGVPVLAPGWSLLREKQAGLVSFCLATYQSQD
ncbi:MAG: rsmD [Hydrocarboniphaga sp.]|uniref:16S rRNA (guanine(966)-N(2))-methyltransferase RsmD n=1 Tax=Hydrocarboniphaga sp. TaxID=2033016 RepID=UPI00261CFAFF|nr:16S rRNA (guanine(966)-N(2))-methyltransferase RsmD [Hydrocarboniphaga sp.]MDB5973122.1 rsmD [Hydrocarboniphaga sp.]